MKKDAIILMLHNNHQAFIRFIQVLSDESFAAEPNGKWSAGRQMLHIILSIRPLNRGLILPAFILKFIFGKANRPSRTYLALVSRYHEKLAAGGAAPSAFVPRVVSAGQRGKLARTLDVECARLCRKVDRFSEAELDSLVAPHPLLGKVTLREMLYFTAYHVTHHHELIKKNLAL